MPLNIEEATEEIKPYLEKMKIETQWSEIY